MGIIVLLLAFCGGSFDHARVALKEIAYLAFAQFWVAMLAGWGCAAKFEIIGFIGACLRTFIHEDEVLDC